MFYKKYNVRGKKFFFVFCVFFTFFSTNSNKKDPPKEDPVTLQTTSPRRTLLITPEGNSGRGEKRLYLTPFAHHRLDTIDFYLNLVFCAELRHIRRVAVHCDSLIIRTKVPNQKMVAEFPKRKPAFDFKPEPTFFEPNIGIRPSSCRYDSWRQKSQDIPQIILCINSQNHCKTFSKKLFRINLTS